MNDALKILLKFAGTFVAIVGGAYIGNIIFKDAIKTAMEDTVAQQYEEVAAGMEEEKELSSADFVSYSMRAFFYDDELWKDRSSVDIVIESPDEFEVLSIAFGRPWDEGFYSTFGEMNADFFDKNVLLVRILPSGSGADAYDVKGVFLNSHSEPVILTEYCGQEWGTCDMGTYFVFASIGREYIFKE